MKAKTKDMIVDAGSIVLTVGTACLVETIAGYGAVSLLNHVFGGTWTKAQLSFYRGIVIAGSAGVAALTAHKTHDDFVNMMQDLVDMFPTDKEEAKEDV